MRNKFSNNYPIINLYNKKSAVSKIVTQMLYGENFTVLRKFRNWYKIKLHTDNYVAFISLLVDRTYTATQYALLASIGTLGRTTLAASSGELVDWLNGDWGIFFVITTVMVIPSLICLWIIRNKLKLSAK